jgi:hypothetical protein
LNFHAPSMVVRGAGAEFRAFARPAGAACDAAGVIGPDGDCAEAAPAERSPTTTMPVRRVNLKKQKAFISDPEFPAFLFYSILRSKKRVPVLRCC